MQLAFFLHLALLAQATAKTWVDLNVTVPSIIDEGDLNYNYVDLFVGTPPQHITLPIDTQSDVTIMYSERCYFCPGSHFLDEATSSTFNYTDLPINSTSRSKGTWARDTINLGGVVQKENTDFVVVEWMSTNVTGPRPRNGQLGLVQEAFRSYNFSHIFADLYQSGDLIDPVIGMRLDPVNPRLTVGAIDPNDYEGTLNWVEIEPNDIVRYTQFHVFKIDGFKGRNGSLIPYETPLLTAVDTMFINIATPDNSTYFSSSNYTGPIYNNSINIEPDFGDISIPCDSTKTVFPGEEVPLPYIDFSVSINGVSYQVDVRDNLIRNSTITGFAPPGFCNVGITTNNLLPQEPKAILGLPFLRSVYMAYRFPTDSCPGYFGFAFPRGANRTDAQIAQKPTSTPTLSSQCLRFATPTSTPSVSSPAEAGGKEYAVFGDESLQVQLIGADQLVKGIWNITSG